MSTAIRKSPYPEVCPPTALKEMCFFITLLPSNFLLIYKLFTALIHTWHISLKSEKAVQQVLYSFCRNKRRDCNNTYKKLSNISCISDCGLGMLLPRPTEFPEYCSFSWASKIHGDAPVSFMGNLKNFRFKQTKKQTKKTPEGKRETSLSQARGLMKMIATWNNETLYWKHTVKH